MLLLVNQFSVFVCQVVWAITNKLNFFRSTSIMPAYASMLEVTYYAQNYASIIHQWLLT